MPGKVIHIENLRGLQENEIETLQKRFGKNIFSMEKSRSFLHVILDIVREPMFLLLIFACILYFLLKQQSEDLVVKQFEKKDRPDHKILEQGNILKDVITSIRDVRNKNQVKPKDKIKLHIQTGHKHNYSSIEDILAKQVNAETVAYTGNAVDNSISVLVNKDKFFIETNKAIDTSVQREQLLKDLEYQKGFLASVEKKLSNERFVQNAKAEVIDLERKKKADAEAKIKIIEESLSTI